MSVNRSQSPPPRPAACGIRCGNSRSTASHFVTTSVAATVTSTVQNSHALLLRIFLTLLAVDAIAGMRQSVQAFECNLVSTLVALPEAFRRAIQPAQRLVDVP